MENRDKAEHTKISPTAKISAYWRSLSDIPFSREIAESIGAEESAKQILAEKFSLMAEFYPPMVEARYKAIDSGIKASRTENVLEAACGLSPRGLALAARKVKYVGTDLPEILSETSPIITNIASKLGDLKENLNFQPVNVLEKGQLEDAASSFKGKEFNVCNEGLLMYLDMEEKATMAQHVRDILSRSGGSWITTDVVPNGARKRIFDSLKPQARDRMLSVLGEISSQVGRNIASFDFENESAATKFYESLGFEINRLPFYDGSQKLSTLSSIPEDMRQPVLSILSEYMVWILKPKK